MFKTVTWNTGPAAARARHNLKLKKKIKKLKKAGSNKQQASSSRRHKKDIIMN